MDCMRKLVLYGATDEIKQDEENFKKRFRIDFAKTAEFMELQRGVFCPQIESEKAGQEEVANQFLTQIWPGTYFEQYCSDPENAAKIIYSNVIAAVILSLQYLKSDKMGKNLQGVELIDWLECDSEAYDNYDKMRKTINKKMQQIQKAEKETKVDELELPIGYIPGASQNKFLQPLVKEFFEIEGNARNTQKSHSVSWNILKLVEKKKEIENFDGITPNERRSIKKTYRELCNAINDIYSVEDNYENKIGHITIYFAKELVFHRNNIYLLENNKRNENLFLESSALPMAFYLNELEFYYKRQLNDFKTQYCILLREVFLFSIEYAGYVLRRKKQKDTAIEKIKMAYEIMSNYANETYDFYYGKAKDESIEIGKEMQNIGKYIRRVRERFLISGQIRYYDSKISGEDGDKGYELLALMGPKMPTILNDCEWHRTNESKKIIRDPPSKIEGFKTYFSVVVSDRLWGKYLFYSYESIINEEWTEAKKIHNINKQNDKELLDDKQITLKEFFGGFENGKNGFSIKDFRIEILSEKMKPLIVSGKDSPKIMQDILEECGIKPNRNGRRISAEKIDLMSLYNALSMIGASYDMWAPKTVMKVRLGRMIPDGLMDFEFCLEADAVMTDRGRIQEDSMRKLNQLTTSDTSEKI